MRFRGNGNYEVEEPVSVLLKRFSQDAGTLIRQEITLAKLELRDSVQGLAKNAGKLGAAAGLGLFGGMALLAFVIIGLGALINNYWLSSLLVAALLLGAAALLARGALEQIKQNSLTPAETVQTLKEDQRWAKREAQDFKQSLKSSNRDTFTGKVDGYGK